MAMQQQRNIVRLVLGSAIAGSVLIAPVAAQQALPPPPSVPDLAPLPSLQPVNPLMGTMTPPQEAIFQAPAQVPNSAASYQVLVNGDSPYLLQQIQRVDASAFLREHQGKRMIQAGVFSTSVEAQQRVAMLNQQGIGAQVVTAATGYQNQVMPSYPNSYPNPAMGMNPNAFNSNTFNPNAINSNAINPNSINPNAMNAEMPRVSHYEVVVPTPEANYAMITNKMMAMGVRPEAIQTKRSPNGPHVAVGPFIQQREAESVSSYLRSGGMDARVFYSR
jgi:hypothetical protein